MGTDVRLRAGSQRLKVSRFETVTVHVRLPGHRPWHTTAYLKDVHNALEARLDPLPGTKGKK